MMYQVLDCGMRPVYRLPACGLLPLMMPARGDLRARMRGWSARAARLFLLGIGGTVRPA